MSRCPDGKRALVDEEEANMRGGRAFQSYTPQQMLTEYHNRIVVAVWLLILAGGLTIAEPFTLFYQRAGVSLGLVAPSVVTRLAGAAAGSLMHIGAAAAGGGLMIALGILAGRGKKSAAILGAALLVIDFALVFVTEDGRRIRADAPFPLIVTGILRYIFVRYIVHGIWAVGKRAELAQKMEAADREYEAAQMAKAASKPTPTGKPSRWRDTEEDAYQG
jgi:hypothetical protein